MPAEIILVRPCNAWLEAHSLAHDCAAALTILFMESLTTMDVEYPDWLLTIALGMAE